jgi:hypothetical protein
VALGLLLLPGAAPAQALRIHTLHLPEDAAPGPWASFHVRTQSRNFPPREFTQRVAIVAAEGIGEEAGVWVELKTIDPRAGTRMERGFFVRRNPGELADRPEGERRTLGIQRLQRLSVDGRLYEYPPDAETELRADEEVATVGLFEVSYLRAPTIDTLGVDTLRLGRKEFVSRAIRTQYVGSDEWPHDQDTSRAHRALLTLITSRCEQVPVTGYTRSLFEVRVGSFATADTFAVSPLPPLEGESEEVFSRAELTLTDMGGGAVPEVTQEAEPAPLSEESEPRPGPVR